MIAIRGATTVDKDCPEQIKECVKELLLELKNRNNLTSENIICIILSNTSDIRSYYPAKAAREAGFYSVPLFSASEPDIEGGLKLCIRIMILAEISTPAKAVYLRGATVLRKDITQIYNIALDGPAGSGKSTVSKILGKKLNILCLDTGAMYRACALKCLYEGVSVSDETAVSFIMKNINLEVKYENGEQHTFLDGKDVSADIRKPEISMLASTVSALGCVREKMVSLQREIAAKTSCVLDGRDIGTNVLPNAKFKFYLTASPEVRAKRRVEDNRQKGFVTPYDEILKEIIERDNQDKNRKIAPLLQAKDAILIDSSQMTIDEVVSFIENKIQEKI